jgi:membrane-bound lytic murein transglycosylase A
MNVLKFRFLVIFWIILFVCACATTPKKLVTPAKPAEKAKPGLCLVPPDQIPQLTDDLDQASLETAINRSLQYFNQISDKRVFRFGNENYTVQEMRESLISLLMILKIPVPSEIKNKMIQERFDFYKSSGRNESGKKVLFTGYFEPVLEGSLVPDEHYKYPVYRTPEDMISIDLGKFKSKFKGERIAGRYTEGRVIPYYNRKNIVSENCLSGRGLEIAWLADPVDAFFLHIQGSGVVMLPDGKALLIGYADGNGRPYRSIGRYLLDSGKITERDLSHRNIKKYLREHPEEMESILNQNESYIFFRIVKEGPIGSLGLVLTAGRSIATDPEFFPRGGLAFIRLRKPVFDSYGEIQSWVDFSRFVLNHDTGGVIKGPGRVDIFCGRGIEAEQIAGSFKENGDLYFLVIKKTPAEK